MKIVSKFKDYYDWVVFETDYRKIYVRDRLQVVSSEKNFNEKKHVLWPYDSRQWGQRIPYCEFLRDHTYSYVGLVWFCNKVYRFLFFDGKYYWRYEDIPNAVIKAIRPKSYPYPHEIGSILNKEIGVVLEHRKWSEPKDAPRIPATTTYNRDLNSPAIALIGMSGVSEMIVNQNLGDLEFNKVVPPQQAYQEIYNWIEYTEPVMPANPNDLSRYEAKGFDKKTSFRPKMK